MYRLLLLVSCLSLAAIASCFLEYPETVDYTTAKRGDGLVRVLNDDRVKYIGTTWAWGEASQMDLPPTDDSLVSPAEAVKLAEPHLGTSWELRWKHVIPGENILRGETGFLRTTSCARATGITYAGMALV